MLKHLLLFALCLFFLGFKPSFAQTLDELYEKRDLAAQSIQDAKNKAIGKYTELKTLREACEKIIEIRIKKAKLRQILRDSIRKYSGKTEQLAHTYKKTKDHLQNLLDDMQHLKDKILRGGHATLEEVEEVKENTTLVPSLYKKVQHLELEIDTYYNYIREKNQEIEKLDLEIQEMIIEENDQIECLEKCIEETQNLRAIYHQKEAVYNDILAAITELERTEFAQGLAEGAAEVLTASLSSIVEIITHPIDSASRFIDIAKNYQETLEIIHEELNRTLSNIKGFSTLPPSERGHLVGKLSAEIITLASGGVGLVSVRKSSEILHFLKKFPASKDSLMSGLKKAGQRLKDSHNELTAAWKSNPERGAIANKKGSFRNSNSIIPKGKSGAENLPSLKGKSVSEVEKILEQQGFVPKGPRTEAGYRTYVHPDKSKVDICPGGRIVRNQAPKYDPKTGQRINRGQRVDSNGNEIPRHIDHKDHPKETIEGW